MDNNMEVKRIRKMKEYQNIKLRYQQTNQMKQKKNEEDKENIVATVEEQVRKEDRTKPSFHSVVK